MQWVEEADREDPIIPLKKGYKAFNCYTLPDGRIASLWKHALTSISEDGGHTWQNRCFVQKDLSTVMRKSGDTSERWNLRYGL